MEGLVKFLTKDQRQHFEEYQSDLASDKTLNASPLERMWNERLDTFRDGRDYGDWTQAKESSMLILTGLNYPSIACLDKCWLSPVATTLITDLEKDAASGRNYAYYIFPQYEPMYHALCPILHTLRSKKSPTCSGKPGFYELGSDLLKLGRYCGEGPWVTASEREKTAFFQQVALRVIEYFDESETVHIVLDRADRCVDPRIGWNSLGDHCMPLLETLVKMMGKAKCKLKVLVVFHGNWCAVDRKRLGLLAQHSEPGRGRVLACSVEQSRGT